MMGVAGHFWCAPSRGFLRVSRQAQMTHRFRSQGQQGCLVDWVKVIFWAVCRSMKPLVIGVWCGWLDFSFWCDVRVGQRLRSLGRRHQESIREVPRHRHRVLARPQAYGLNLCTRSICRHDLFIGRMPKPNRMSMSSRKLASTSDGGVRSITDYGLLIRNYGNESDWTIIIVRRLFASSSPLSTDQPLSLARLGS